MTLRALCKYRGMLVVATFTRCLRGQLGRCPECQGTEFRDEAGWVECYGCGFSILKTDYDKMTAAKAAGDE